MAEWFIGGIEDIKNGQATFVIVHIMIDNLFYRS